MTGFQVTKFMKYINIIWKEVLHLHFFTNPESVFLESTSSHDSAGNLSWNHDCKADVIN